MWLCRVDCDQVGRMVEGEGYSTTVLHGGKSQDTRDRTLADFKAGKHEVGCAPYLKQLSQCLTLVLEIHLTLVLYMAWTF